MIIEVESGRWGAAIGIIATVLVSGCSYQYRIDLSGTVTSEDGKPLVDVAVSSRDSGGEAPSSTEKWTYTGGKFEIELTFLRKRSRDGSLASQDLWFKKEGYKSKKIEVQFPYEPKSYGDIPKLNVAVTLERVEE